MGIHGNEKYNAVVLVPFSDTPVIRDIDGVILRAFASDRVYCNYSNLDGGAIVVAAPGLKKKLEEQIKDVRSRLHIQHSRDMLKYSHSDLKLKSLLKALICTFFSHSSIASSLHHPATNNLKGPSALLPHGFAIVSYAANSVVRNELRLHFRFYLHPSLLQTYDAISCDRRSIPWSAPIYILYAHFSKVILGVVVKP
jgi:hypothetical protein